MSDISSSTPFRFEMLPDEMLLEIFKYVNPIDLHSFVGHNLRIDNVIRDVQLNIVIEYPGEKDKDLNYLTSFLPNQIIRLEVRYGWNAFDINIFKKLRSLTLDCHYLWEKQFFKMLSVYLPYLKRLSIDNGPHYYGKGLLLSILDNEHFPSLKVCQLSGKFYYTLELNEDCQSPNNTLRTLVINRWIQSKLGPLLNLLPNLRRFETNILERIHGSLNFNAPHISLEHLRITLNDPSNGLEKLLQYMPNLKQLHVTGKITEVSVLKHFEKLTKIFRSHTHNLQKFDCELYFHAWNNQVNVIVIQQLHPLFKTIQCHLGKKINQCYATNLTEYPSFSEYSYKYKSFF